MASNTILAYAMEQGDKMALTGMRNPILGKADVSAAQGCSPGKVQGSGRWSKKGMWEGADPQAVLGLVAHSSNLISGEWGLFESWHYYKQAVLAGKIQHQDTHSNDC